MQNFFNNQGTALQARYFKLKGKNASKMLSVFRLLFTFFF